MGEGRSHWSSMVLRKSQTCFFDRHTHPSSMYSNFCHVLKKFVFLLLPLSATMASHRQKVCVENTVSHFLDASKKLYCTSLFGTRYYTGLSD